MKINEIGTLNLNEVVFKLSKKSITVKGTDNKTKAVINDIKKLSELQPNKKFEIHSIYKDIKLNKYSNELYVDDDKQLYCIIDQKYHELTLKLLNNGMVDEFKRLNSKVNELANMKINVFFLNVA